MCDAPVIIIIIALSSVPFSPPPRYHTRSHVTADHLQTALMNTIVIFLFIFFCYVAYVLIKDAFFKKQKDALYVASFSLPVLLFFNAIATFNEILPHWPAMGYLILTIYASYVINKFWDNSKFRKLIYFSCGFALFLDLIVPIHCIYKFIPIYTIIYYIYSLVNR